jgi:hypothetical protein
MYKKIQIKQIKPAGQAYIEVVAAYESCIDPVRSMTKASTAIIKKAIDDNFVCVRASEYRQILYGSMYECNMIPTNKATGKPFILRETASILADINNYDVEFMRSIGKFYQNVRTFLKEYQRPEASTCFTLENINTLKDAAPYDALWFQMVSELQVYARDNDLFSKHAEARIAINGNVPDERCKAFISYLTMKHPINKEVVFYFEEREYIFTNGCCSNAVMFPSVTGPIRISIAAKTQIGIRGILRALAREYCHVLQEYRDGMNFIGNFNQQLLVAAERFGIAEIAAAVESGVIVFDLTPHNSLEDVSQ